MFVSLTYSTSSAAGLMGGAFLSLGSHCEDPKSSLGGGSEARQVSWQHQGSGAVQEAAVSTQSLQECSCPFQQSKHTDIFEWHLHRHLLKILLLAVSLC